MAGWAGCLGTPARGATAAEQEVAVTIGYQAQVGLHFSFAIVSAAIAIVLDHERPARNSSSGTGRDSSASAGPCPHQALCSALLPVRARSEQPEHAPMGETKYRPVDDAGELPPSLSSPPWPSYA